MRRFVAVFSLLVFTVLLSPASAGFADSARAAQVATPEAAPAATGQTVDVDGAEIYYEIHGVGPPLVLLHAGLGSGINFSGQIPALAQDFQVIVIDSRGHGRSTHGPEPITYERMAADVLAVLDHLGISAADVVGWSDGGNIGLELAIHHPERVRKLVAYGANFSPEGAHDPGPSPEMDALFGQLAADYQQLAPDPDGFEALLGEMFALYAVAPDFSEAQLQSITTPVLVLAGAEEEFIDPEHTAKLAELIPGAELVIMPGAGHFAPWEQPEEFTRIVKKFLQA